MVNLFGLELLPSTINFLGYVLILRDLSEISRGGTLNLGSEMR